MVGPCISIADCDRLAGTYRVPPRILILRLASSATREPVADYLAIPRSRLEKFAYFLFPNKWISLQAMLSNRV